MDKERPEETKPVADQGRAEHLSPKERRLLNLSDELGHSTGEERREVAGRVEELAEDRDDEAGKDEKG